LAAMQLQVGDHVVDIGKFWGHFQLISILFRRKAGHR
jgi:hypothetical protein